MSSKSGQTFWRVYLRNELTGTGGVLKLTTYSEVHKYLFADFYNHTQNVLLSRSYIISIYELHKLQKFIDILVFRVCVMASPRILKLI
jgi:hypothetical protein